MSVHSFTHIYSDSFDRLAEVQNADGNSLGNHEIHMYWGLTLCCLAFSCWPLASEDACKLFKIRCELEAMPLRSYMSGSASWSVTSGAAQEVGSLETWLLPNCFTEEGRSASEIGDCMLKLLETRNATL